MAAAPAGDDILVLLADVALPVPLAHAFTYVVPEALAARAVAGARVICSFAGRRLVGVVLAVREGEPPKGAKPIARVVDEPPAVPEDSLAFLRDLAAYYFAPIGEVMRLALPPVERETARELAEPSLFDRSARRRRAHACSGSTRDRRASRRQGRCAGRRRRSSRTSGPRARSRSRSSRSAGGTRAPR